MARNQKSSVMDIHEATHKYESWLGKQLTIIDDDLKVKHDAMAGDPFSFLRATFYRWAQLFPIHCKLLAGAPAVFSVGDLHVENFGTWHDAEGRMIWGVNDFDEVCDLPYTNDLVRLAVSALLAIRQGHLLLDRGEACTALLDGYAKGFKDGGKPFVLSERHRWLYDMVTSRQRSPARFWAKLAALPTLEKVPESVTELLEGALPQRGLEYRVIHRQAGLGSLGRERVTALAVWSGGSVAREAKALVPSACVWAAKHRDKTIGYSKMLRTAIRAPDPFLSVRGPDKENPGVKGTWVLRRLSPYCSRIELAQLPDAKDEIRLLRAMGRETANIHLGTTHAHKKVGRDLQRRKSRWLWPAAEAMLEATLADWKAWKKGQPPPKHKDPHQ